ncbi:hypothetical protein [Clostridium novyi]|nr:hypothetical protein [Clostridium novyi]
MKKNNAIVNNVIERLGIESQVVVKDIIIGKTKKNSCLCNICGWRS